MKYPVHLISLSFFLGSEVGTRVGALSQRGVVSVTFSSLKPIFSWNTPLERRLHSSFISFTALSSSGAPVGILLMCMFSLTSLAAIGCSFLCSFACFCTEQWKGKEKGYLQCHSDHAINFPFSLRIQISPQESVTVLILTFELALEQHFLGICHDTDPIVPESDLNMKPILSVESPLWKEIT